MIHLEYLLILAGGAVVSSRRAAALAGTAGVASGLAIAALEAGPLAGRTGPEALAALPSGFAAVEGSLLLAAALLAGAAVRAAVRDRQRRRDTLGALGLAAGGIWAGAVGVQCIAASDARFLLPALAAVLALGVLLGLAGRRWPGGSSSSPAASAPAAYIAAMGVGAFLAAVASRAGLIFVGVVVTAVAGYLTEARGATRRLPVTPLLTLLLVPAWWLMATIAGPQGLAVGSLADLPWSPAAERALAPVLLVSAWALAGLWPLQRQVPALLTAPVGALLLGRVGIPVAPDGIVHWRALAMPVIVAGLWHAAMTRRRAATAAGLAWVGLLALEPAGEIGASLLFVGALAMALSDRMPRAAERVSTLVRVAGAVAAGWGALLAVAAGLHAEVVYTVLAAGALAAAAARAGAVQASTASAPSATAASA